MRFCCWFDLNQLVAAAVTKLTVFRGFCAADRTKNWSGSNRGCVSHAFAAADLTVCQMQSLFDRGDQGFLHPGGAVILQTGDQQPCSIGFLRQLSLGEAVFDPVKTDGVGNGAIHTEIIGGGLRLMTAEQLDLGIIGLRAGNGQHSQSCGVLNNILTGGGRSQIHPTGHLEPGKKEPRAAGP